MTLFHVLILAILFSAASVFADCDYKKREQLVTRPDKASVIAVGIVSQKSHILSIVKSWTASPSWVSLGTEPKLDHTELKDQKKYLLLADKVSDKDFRVNKCNSVLISIDDAQKIILKLADSNKFELSRNPSLKFCMQDSDCVDVHGKCGVFTLNKNFVKKYLSSQNRLGSKNKCYTSLGGDGSPTKKGINCSNNFCEHYFLSL